MLLLEKAHVGLVPGGALQSEFLRISYAASEEQLQAMIASKSFTG